MIVITGGCSAKAYKLLKAFPGEEILLADYGAVPQSGGANSIVSLGVLNIDTIAHNLLNFCLDKGATMLIPLNSFEIVALVQAYMLFKEFDIKLLLPEITELEGFLPGNLTHTNEFVLLNDGKQLYPSQPIGNHPPISGVFYMNESGAPVKIFTVD